MYFGIHWVTLRKVMDVMFGRRNWVGKHTSAIWNMVPLCLMWTIWRGRNRQCRVYRESVASNFL